MSPFNRDKYKKSINFHIMNFRPEFGMPDNTLKNLTKNCF